MSALLFLFLDGVGLGIDDPAVNPFAAAATPMLAELLGERLLAGLPEVTSDGRVVRQLDATLETPGLPQSATGQTALLTGINAAAAMGRHYGPWPGPTLRRLLDQGTLFSDTVRAGGRAQLANAYPPGFFTALEHRRLRLSAPLYSARAAGLPLGDLAAWRRGEALPADLDGSAFAALGSTLEPLGAGANGKRLARLAREAEFTFFDIWLLDRIGHRGDHEAGVAFIERLDRFLAGVLDQLGDATLLVTSDHGNVEDLRVGSHTRAAVPLLALGPEAQRFAGCRTLTDVAAAVRAALALPATPGSAPSGTRAQQDDDDGFVPGADQQ